MNGYLSIVEKSRQKTIIVIIFLGLSIVKIKPILIFTFQIDGNNHQESYEVSPQQELHAEFADAPAATDSASYQDETEESDLAALI